MADQFFAWTHATASHIDQIFAVQCVAHALHPERAAVLAERIALCAEGCFVLGNGASIAGYVLSHPWSRFSPPPLDTLLGSLPSTCDVWYLHDLALLPIARGAGAGRSVMPLLDHAARHAGFRRMALVSVNGSRLFWEKQGFDVRIDKSLATKLPGYGEDAVYMERPIDG